MPEIIRFEEKRWDSLYVRYIYGLTIFDENQVPDVEDAMVTFLRALVAIYPCAAQIGLLPLEGQLPAEDDDPRMVFAPMRQGEDYFLTHINSYAHGNIWVEPARLAGCFFPHLSEDIFTLCTDEGELLIDYLLMYDQPMLYVNADEHARVQLNALYAHPPLTDEFAAAESISSSMDRASRVKLFGPLREQFEHRWWEAATGIVPLGLSGGHDDATMIAYSRNPAHFALLDRPLEQACEAVRATPWFQAHQHELRWPEEEEEINAWCLLLPERIEEEKAQEARRQENLRKMAE